MPADRVQFREDVVAIVDRVLDRKPGEFNDEDFESQLRTMLSLAFNAEQLARMEDAFDVLGSACFLEKLAAEAREARTAAFAAASDAEITVANPSRSLIGALAFRPPHLKVIEGGEAA